MVRISIALHNAAHSTDTGNRIRIHRPEHRPASLFLPAPRVSNVKPPITKSRGLSWPILRSTDSWSLVQDGRAQFQPTPLPTIWLTLGPVRACWRRRLARDCEALCPGCRRQCCCHWCSMGVPIGCPLVLVLPVPAPYCLTASPGPGLQLTLDHLRRDTDTATDVRGTIVLFLSCASSEMQTCAATGFQKSRPWSAWPFNGAHETASRPGEGY